MIDKFIAFIFLVICSPFIALFAMLVYLSDFHSPFYVPRRIGLNGVKFKFYKLRSMCINADKSCVDSTKSDDERITFWGKVIRKYKIDELLQFYCILCGNMTFVGPRPNVEREVKLYTKEERKLLSVMPGITSVSSIVFSDLGDILVGCKDPNIAYNQLVRPWKNRLDLFYIDKRNNKTDVLVVFATFVSIINRSLSLRIISKLIRNLGGSEELVNIAARSCELSPEPPPGADEIVTARS